VLLPKPYPDEVIGSVLARGCRHLGVAWTRLLRCTAGRSVSSVSYLMPFALRRIAKATGADPDELLEEHTLFPYATAYMNTEQRNALRSRALSGDNCELSTLAHVLYRGSLGRRICPVCLETDLNTRGETFWHRIHLLPGVQVCALHGVPLLDTGIALRDSSCAASLLPIDLVGAPIAHPLRQAVATSVVYRSALTLCNAEDGKTWLERYRLAAVAFGYGLRSSAVSSNAFADDFARFYGPDFLASIGLPVTLDRRVPWPALMVRSQYPTRFAATKHVLMTSFFEHAEPVIGLRTVNHRKPGPAKRDYEKLDLAARRRMVAYLGKRMRRDLSTTVKALISSSRMESSLHAFRDRFPITVNFLAEFRTTRLSARRFPAPVPIKDPELKRLLQRKAVSA
jgi:hypothetical protein